VLVTSSQVTSKTEIGKVSLVETIAE